MLLKKTSQGSSVAFTPSRPSLCSILAILVILCSSSAIAMGKRQGNCSALPMEVMERAGVKYEISGPHILTYPTDAEGNRIQGIFCEWVFDLFVERAKSLDENKSGVMVPTSISPEPEFDLSFLFSGKRDNSSDGSDANLVEENGVQHGTQLDPGSSQARSGKQTRQPNIEVNRKRRAYSTVVDPLEPRIENQPCSSDSTAPCGEILNAIWVSEMDCRGYRETKDFMGHARESYWVHFSHPAYPNFTFIIEHHLIDEHFEYYGNSTGVRELYQFKPGAVKIGYQIINYPWQGSSENIEFGPGWNNASSIGFWANMTVSVDQQVVATYEFSPRGRKFRTATLDGKVNLTADVSSITVLDGEGFDDERNRSASYNQTVDRVYSRSQIRNNIPAFTKGHWHSLTYDPTLAAIFQASPTIEPTSKSRKGLIIAVSVSLSLLALIIAVLVLLVLFVPSIRHYVRPYSKISEEKRKTHGKEPSSTSSPASTSTWLSSRSTHNQDFVTSADAEELSAVTENYSPSAAWTPGSTSQTSDQNIV